MFYNPSGFWNYGGGEKIKKEWENNNFPFLEEYFLCCKFVVFAQLDRLIISGSRHLAGSEVLLAWDCF